MNLCRLVAVLLALTAQRANAETELSTLTPETLSGQFDCADAFDLVALVAVFRCAAYTPPAAAQPALTAALERLQQLGVISPSERATTNVAFCPLAAGTGMVPTPHQVYVDDGLIMLSTDGLAEIIAHELEHVRQFAELGERSFKCAYVEAMTACGGCQDRRHPQELAAYEYQGLVRDQLLREPASDSDTSPDIDESAGPADSDVVQP